MKSKLLFEVLFSIIMKKGREESERYLLSVLAAGAARRVLHRFDWVIGVENRGDTFKTWHPRSRHLCRLRGLSAMQLRRAAQGTKQGVHVFFLKTELVTSTNICNISAK